MTASSLSGRMQDVSHGRPGSAQDACLAGVCEDPRNCD